MVYPIETDGTSTITVAQSSDYTYYTITGSSRSAYQIGSTSTERKTSQYFATESSSAVDVSSTYIDESTDIIMLAQNEA